MTLNQILYFQKVARLENYHQAAEELYISQPSLSRSMAVLESELGVALFEKKGRGVTLTKAGNARIRGEADRFPRPIPCRINSEPEYAEICARELRIISGEEFVLAPNLIAATPDTGKERKMERW